MSSSYINLFIKQQITLILKKYFIHRFLFVFAITVSVVFVNAQDLTHFKENKVTFHGNLSATSVFYNTNGTIQRKPSFSYILGGNFVLNLKGFVFPFSFTYSDQNKNFRQPFNQYGISPRWKWIKIHLGYRNINFSKYVLGGHTILGGGIELTPGKFRFGAVYGRLQKTTNKAYNINNPISDTLSTYSRKALSFKIGYGTSKTFVDFIFLRGYDDSASADTSYYRSGNFPAANVVAGINSRIAFSPVLHLQLESAYSVYTSNQNSFGRVEISPFADKMIPINVSTQGFMAINGKFEYKNRKGFSASVQYRRIDPGYKSMGTYFVNNDVENITVNLGMALFHRKMSFQGSLGTERNNLKTARNATTRKMIGSASLNYNPVQFFGININYSNYSINQQAGRIQIADSVKLYQTNGTFVVMPHFQFIGKGKKASHFISLAYTRMDLNDKNPQSGFNNSFITHNAIFSYALNILNGGFGVNLSLNYNKVEMSGSESTNKGFTIGTNKNLMKGKINFGLSANITNSNNNNIETTIITPVLTARGKFGKHHSIRLKTTMISNRNKNNNQQSYTENIGDISYVFTF